MLMLLRPIFWAIAIIGLMWLPIVGKNLSDLIIFGPGWW